jgi:hypothetical protein
MAAEPAELELGIEVLAEARQHAVALIASGVLDRHLRAHMAGLLDNLDGAVKRQREAEPPPALPQRHRPVPDPAA